MRWLSRLTGAIDAIVRRSKLDSELDDELHAYYSTSVDAKIAAGVVDVDRCRNGLSDRRVCGRVRAGTPGRAWTMVALRAE